MEIDVLFDGLNKERNKHLKIQVVISEVKNHVNTPADGIYQPHSPPTTLNRSKTAPETECRCQSGVKT